MIKSWNRCLACGAPTPRSLEQQKRAIKAAGTSDPINGICPGCDDSENGSKKRAEALYRGDGLSKTQTRFWELRER
jgi:hypothetical protein